MDGGRARFLFLRGSRDLNQAPDQTHYNLWRMEKIDSTV